METSNNKKCKKAINFDLDDKALKVAYPKKSYKAAWADVKKFMVDNGFEHRQYSGYNSLEPMSNNNIFKLVKKLRKELAWLNAPGVIQQIDVTDIGETQSLAYMFGEKHIFKVKDMAVARR